MSFNDLVRKGVVDNQGAGLLETNYVAKTHPLLKLIIFICSVFLVFSKLGIFLHILLIFFTILILFLSGCLKGLYKQLITLFVGIYLFLFCINWVFNKNPGFWNESYLKNDYFDFVEKFSNIFTRSPFSIDLKGRGGGVNSNNNPDIRVGWFAGGSVLEGNCCKELIGCNCQCANQFAGKIIHAKNVEEIKKICKCIEQSNSNCCGKGGNCIKALLEREKFKSFYVLNGTESKDVVVFFPTWYTITALQFILAFNMASKLTMVIAFSKALSHTTDLTAFTFATGELIRPFSVLKIPVKEITLIISLAIRFIPTLLLEAIRIVKAQSSRGIDFKNGKLKDKATAFLSLFIPLFIISMIKSKELSNAMISRAYLPKEDRTRFRVYSLDRSQLVVFGILMSFIIMCYYFVLGSYYFSPFKEIDAILLLSL